MLFVFPLSFVLFSVLSCTSREEFRISGEFENLQQTELYIYSSTGATDELDTIRVTESRFDWRTPLTSEAVFHIIFPNMTEQVVFATPGDHIRLHCDGNHLKAMTLKGNKANEAYTRFRLDHLDASPDSIQAAMRAYVKANPEASEALYMQRLLTTAASHICIFRKGDRLPDIILPPDSLSSDTATFMLHAAGSGDNGRSDGKYTLLLFWAGWKSDSHGINLHAFRYLKDNSRLLQAVSISLDTDTVLYRLMSRQDSINWTSRCYRRSWDTPVVRQLGIRNIPYIILADKNRTVVAAGTNWERDIKPLLPAKADDDKKGR